jgi:hypothetical protein
VNFFKITVDEVMGEANRLYKEKYGREMDMQSKQIASLAESIVDLLNHRLQNILYDIDNLEAAIRHMQDKF